MTQYYDPDSRSIKRAVYTWDDTNDSSTSWEDLTEWETGTGGLYTLGAGDPITFRSEIRTSAGWRMLIRFAQWWLWAQ